MTTSLRFAVIVAVFAMSGVVTPGQTPATGRVMRDKLTHAQKILEAVMTSDYVALETHSTALARATELPGWFELKSPEYRRQSEAFVHATQALADAAKRRDLDAAALQYVSVTLTCFECHRYLKNMRIARR